MQCNRQAQCNAIAKQRPGPFAPCAVAVRSPRQTSKRARFMSLGILGMGTAVPGSAVAQHEAEGIARALCCRTAEHATWLPGVYQQSGIRTRYLAFPPEVVRDVIDGTRHTDSVFLPTGAADDRGPSTAARMQ